MKRTAFITGITGQDGAYLAQNLLMKGYDVHGLVRRSSLPNTGRLEELLSEIKLSLSSVKLHTGDLTDGLNIRSVIDSVKPDEIYNLGAQSHVGVSFESPEYTANVNGLGTLRILEAIRVNKRSRDIKFYQASTSELYGLVQEIPQTETTPFYPRSPYAIAKLLSYWMTINYRESFGIFACNGILFNHESPFRGENFVTKKIVSNLVKIKLGIIENFKLGNLDAKRDWGHARDYVEMQYQMLQQDKPDDYVIATGLQYTVRDFVNLVAKALDMDLSWQGLGLAEVGILNKSGKIIISVDKNLYRPAEVETLIGNAQKAKNVIGWQSKTSIWQLAEEMINYDMKKYSREIK